MSRPIHVYRLVIIYPEGSQAPGWRPALWSDPEFLARLSRRSRRALARTTFTWPAERMFLSSSSAWNRAGKLLMYGAQVEVQASKTVTW